MLGHPAVAAGHGRGDAQRVALLAQQGVAAVAGAEGPDLVGLREVGDVLLVVAGPGGVLLVLGQRGADGVDGRDPGAALGDEVHGGRTHAGHDPHVDHHVGGVGQLDAELGDGAAQRTHGEGDHVEGPAAHGAVELLVEDLLHLGRVVPVVGRAGVLLLLGADEGPGLHTGDVAGQGAREEGVGALVGVEAREHAGLHHLGGEAVPLLL